MEKNDSNNAVYGTPVRPNPFVAALKGNHVYDGIDTTELDLNETRQKLGDIVDNLENDPSRVKEAMRTLKEIYYFCAVIDPYYCRLKPNEADFIPYHLLTELDFMRKLQDFSNKRHVNVNIGELLMSN